MNQIAISIYLLALLLSLALTILFLLGKGAALIAGYNTLSPEEKARYDEPALCKFMGKITLGVSFSIVLWLLGEWLGLRDIFLPIGFALITLLCFFTVIYTNTGNRFRRDD